MQYDTLLRQKTSHMDCERQKFDVHEQGTVGRVCQGSETDLSSREKRQLERCEEERQEKLNVRDEL